MHMQIGSLHLKSVDDSLTLELPGDLCFAAVLAQEKEASSWLTSFSMVDYNACYALRKAAI